MEPAPVFGSYRAILVPWEPKYLFGLILVPMVVSLFYLGSFSPNYFPGSNLSPPCVGVTPAIELLDISFLYILLRILGSFPRI